MNPEASQPPSGPTSQADTPPPPMPASTQPPFDPSRMIGIIKRKALIKELAAVYHTECLAYCQELLELQKKWEEPPIDIKSPNDSRKEKIRPPKPKRVKKTR
ncbi:hypothetical protein SLE2022_387010 [Rubroshorea leprosula]|uniref:Uncharacterized protein n=1 Tax=Rubroshorea leprosula TaxID=152421 RepID=A0AAV5HUW8_9ROSI|nr:hypothetical protein SLEP1_g6325 [Rubroshorea leprosula]